MALKVDDLGNMLKGLGDNDEGLKYVYKVKSNEVTYFNELTNQVSGQANRIARDILDMRNDVTNIHWAIELK
ncbi:hypothetical protein [Clostridium sp. UBA6640]|uniref:hypothetical protein n=1 Tax=Clostridium sp. UBA6640 TaxID=1946370 RepID=UPI0025BA44E7|nr:hypothetical protein [Clostridium sp. UBA6640]